MNRKIAIIVALQAFLIVMLFWVLVFYGKDEYESYMQGESEEEIETPNRVTTDKGITIVTLPPEAQLQSGIQTSRLASSDYRNALSTYGTVVNIDSLIDQRSRYLTAKAEASIARASLANTQQEFNRLSLLNQDNRNVSDRAVANAEALLKADEARVNAAENIARNLRDSIRQQWGEVLAAEATRQPETQAFARILQYRDVLIQATLPFDSPTPQAGNKISVIPAGARGQPIQAQFISASPQIDATVQGKTYYYLAPAEALRVGMRVSIKMPGNEKSVQGVVVPNSAVVWYGGKAWAYRKEDEEKFVRLSVSTDRETDAGWFNSAGLSNGDEVVTTGAQLLLSEEFKYQITNENDD
ncbi:hypothetical protein MTYP_01217 [Methylophilaceae bacterium]|nr:hypothetical protein MTYP_01217 [Methylophilaceae bacterium]